MFLKRAVKLYPDKIGVVCGGHRFTYREFQGRVHRLSHLISKLGIQKGDVVAFLSHNCHRLLEAYYGIVQAGAILLPLNIRLTAADIQYILNHSQAKVLFLEPDFVDTVASIRTQILSVRSYIPLETVSGPDWLDPLSYDQQLQQSESTPVSDPPEDENEVAELFYTSGTTDRPKGVMLTHRNLHLHALNVILALQTQDKDVQLHTIALYHANGWGAVHSTTCMGGTHVMLRRFDAKALLRLVESERITTFNLVPTMATLLLQQPELESYNLDSLRLIHMGGSAVPMEMVRQVEQRFRCQCTCGYGLTETSPVLTMALPKSHLPQKGEDFERRRATTGLELPGCEVRVLDADGNDVAPDGTSVGEIVTRSNTVMEGYWKEPKETARVIRNGWFHTGDMATIDPEGYILIVDRQKDMIISGGENISSIEIEKALYAHPGISECAVIAIPDAKWGEVPRAIIVPKSGSALTEGELRLFCRQQLAAYKIPAQFQFVASLPKSGTGKILKKLLRSEAWEGFEKKVN
jgi:fatty-acyl-CoA synthase